MWPRDHLQVETETLSVMGGTYRGTNIPNDRWHGQLFTDCVISYFAELPRCHIFTTSYSGRAAGTSLYVTLYHRKYHTYSHCNSFGSGAGWALKREDVREIEKIHSTTVNCEQRAHDRRTRYFVILREWSIFRVVPGICNQGIFRRDLSFWNKAVSKDESLHFIEWYWFDLFKEIETKYFYSS